MVNVFQYPYDLEKLSKEDAVFDEETGSWTEGKKEWKFISKCRDENNTGGKTITTDGEVYVYGALIQMPKGDKDIKEGEKIRVIDSSGNTRLKADVKLFVSRQLHSQLWV